MFPLIYSNNLILLLLLVSKQAKKVKIDYKFKQELTKNSKWLKTN